MTELDAEYGSAWARTPAAILDRYEAARHFGLLGFGHVLIEKRTYQPTPHGEPALIIACRGDPSGDPECDHPFAMVTGGPLLDLITVPFKRPQSWAARIGSATFLGACEPQFVSPPPVPIWRSPINWVRSGCEGICLLTDDAREKQAILLRFRSIAAEDVKHGEELRKIAARPWVVPRIVVPRQKAAA